MTTVFKIKSYGKGQLASLYMPDILSKSAWNIFRTWMERNPRLKPILETAGPRRRFIPCEVRTIVEELGEP